MGSMATGLESKQASRHFVNGVCFWSTSFKCFPSGMATKDVKLHVNGW